MRLVWWLATVVAIGLVSIILSHQGTTDPVRNLSLTVTSPLQGGLRDIASPIDDFFAGVTDRGSLVRENERLREELERYKVQATQRQDAEQRARDLEAALGVRQSRPGDQLVVANVIAQEPSGVKREVAIDRGQSDGLDEGMVVLSRGGSLIGTISRVYKDFAWVRLVTDPNSAVNAQVDPAAPAPAQDSGSQQVLTPGTPAPQASPTPSPATPTPSPSSNPQGDAVRGVAEGDLRNGLVLDLLPADAPVKPGDLVVTSGLGGNYPRALFIGSIKEIEERPQAPFKTASVEPATGLADLDTVLVLVSFKPARLSGP